MKVFNIGPMELVFILIILMIVLGPKDIAKYARKAGRMIRTVTNSSLWREFMSASREIQEFPRKVMREAELDTVMEEVKSSFNEEVVETEQVLLDLENEISGKIQPEGGEIEDPQEGVGQKTKLIDTSPTDKA